MNEFKIWDTDEKVNSYFMADTHVSVFSSLRIGNRYKISIPDGYYFRHRSKSLSRTKSDRLKARLATILIDRTVNGEEEPRIDKKLINHVIENTRSLPVPQRARRLLRFMTAHEEGIHVPIQFLIEESIFEIALGLSESINKEELKYFLDYLEEFSLVKSGEDHNWGYVATIKGHEFVEQERIIENSNKVFVAMWFDNEMDQVWKTIKKAIERAGYESIRVDLENFDGLIDDKVVAEIRGAKFVIADLTHGDEGHRGSVYYEAGFARGLNKPVIQTVQEDYLDKVAFDLSHYPVISWCQEDLKGFEETLQNRIESRFGIFLQS